MFDAEDRAVLRQWVVLGVLGALSLCGVAGALGLAWRVFTAVAGL